VTGDSAGNLYGTTLLGGEWNAGVVYKLDPTGHETVLHSFPQNDGWACSPSPGVIRDSEGNLYGTVPACLQSNAAGLVYKIDTANNWTVLYSFTGGADGGSPKAGVIRDSAGNLYGTTASGGDSTACNGYGCGVVYKLDATGHETVLYSFKGGADGVGPGGVIRDSAGNLYGTTGSGGTGNAGVVYKLDKTGHETVLYSFSSQTNGEYPSAVIRDAAGNLYGTAQCGGTSGSGMVYNLGPSGNLTVLYNGEYSSAGVIRDSADNLYGTTQYGGTAGLGVVYKLDPAGNETVLYSFSGGADGGNPEAGVIRDPAGNFYGTTTIGGTAGVGVVYELDPAGHETVLYSFTGGADGKNPDAGVIRDSAGNLYGTTHNGGTADAGVVYTLDPAGQETVLYSFSGGADGGNPDAGVIRDSAGNLYGTTDSGGEAGEGVVYKLDPSGHETVLYSFTGLGGAVRIEGGVIRDSAGNLYGTTWAGGPYNAGVIFKLDPAGNYTVLYAFSDAWDGGYPHGGVVRDSAGNLYGTAVNGGATAWCCGVVFKLDTAGNYTVLHSFSNGADGAFPETGVIRDSAGNLYGTTSGGGTAGAAGAGVVYEVDANGQETVLYSFTGGADGGTPWASLIGGAAGQLYGTTTVGGKANSGAVCEIKPATTAP
jgi:uncharacterized repeat protein (TIGR03803 family)